MLACCFPYQRKAVFLYATTWYDTIERASLDMTMLVRLLKRIIYERAERDFAFEIVLESSNCLSDGGWNYFVLHHWMAGNKAFNAPTIAWLRIDLHCLWKIVEYNQHQKPFGH